MERTLLGASKRGREPMNEKNGGMAQRGMVVVRKNSIRLPCDRDAGTYLFGFPALGSPKNQSCEQKMLLSRADRVQS
jgi:hypothetical protein